LQHVAAGILDDALAIFVAAFRNCLRPFETAVGADVVEGRPGIMKNSPKIAYSSELKSEF